jgi:hypothetical protein
VIDAAGAVVGTGGSAGLTPSREVRAAMVRQRVEGRLAEYGWCPGDSGAVPGGCSWMSEVVSARFGYQEDGGCYDAGDGRHIAHCWNVLPDGAILDTTADQFGEPGDGIRITKAGDPRYLGECDCGGVDG